MTDISKCKGTGCPLRDTCFRYTAKTGDWQSWFTDVPYRDGKCDYYWPLVTIPHVK